MKEAPMSSPSQLFAPLCLFFVIGGIAVSMQHGNCLYFLPVLIVLVILSNLINGGNRGGGRRR
jgi:hypothetical protein